MSKCSILDIDPIEKIFSPTYIYKYLCNIFNFIVCFSYNLFKIYTDSLKYDVCLLIMTKDFDSWEGNVK
jgi:hypothetical protein